MMTSHREQTRKRAGDDDIPPRGNTGTPGRPRCPLASPAPLGVPRAPVRPPRPWASIAPLGLFLKSAGVVGVVGVQPAGAPPSPRE